MAKCIVFYYSMFFNILSAEFSRIKRRLPQSSLTAVCSRRLQITSAAYNGDSPLRQPRAVILIQVFVS